MLLAPDDLLPVGPARWTRETVSEAWQHERRRLREALADTAVRQVVCLVGVPGSGKSTWALDHDQLGMVIFDACWAEAGKRRALAAQIRAAGKLPIAVWLRTPLAVCRERNAARPPERRVPDVALLRACVALRDKPPTVAEGWAVVLEVDGTAERIHDAAIPPERQFERAARLPANVAWRLLRANVLPELARQQPGEGVPKSVERALATMERQLARAVDDRVAEAVGRIGKRIEKRERQAWNELVTREIGEDWTAPEAGELVSDWTERQANRLREIRAGIVPGVRAAIEEARRKGWSVAQLEETWKAEGLPLDGYGTAEGRGRVLAQEAATGLVQEATRAAQEAAGAEWYAWELGPSEEHRPEHAARRGKLFRWDDPPEDGPPGTLPGCKCYPRPVLKPKDVRRLKAGGS